jgi:HD-GYP domain-containing protein (c-di-GMP phosphodiesterase class II)
MERNTSTILGSNCVPAQRRISSRARAYTISIAKSVPVPLPYLTVLARAAFLHDIGKMAIPDKILCKPGALYDAEKVIMRTHCEIGYNVLTRIPFLRDAADIVLAHQEFFDGSGYPRQLRGEQIPLGARIISIANTLDAMLSDWPYRNAHVTRWEWPAVSASLRSRALPSASMVSS